MGSNPFPPPPPELGGWKPGSPPAAPPEPGGWKSGSPAAPAPGFGGWNPGTQPAPVAALAPPAADAQRRRLNGLLVAGGIVLCLLAVLLAALHAAIELHLLSGDTFVRFDRYEIAFGFDVLPGIGFAAPPLMLLAGVVLVTGRRWGAYIGLASLALTMLAVLARYIPPSSSATFELGIPPTALAVTTALLVVGLLRRGDLRPRQ